jgi:hypothetical protein
MKQRLLLIGLFIAPFYFIACNKQTCITPGIVFELSLGVNPDTIMNVVQYRKNGNFSDSVGSFKNSPLYAGPVGTTMMMFPAAAYTNNAYYDYDWIMTLVPSGKVYKISNLSHGNAKRNMGMGEVKDACVNTISCNVNGKGYKVNESNSTSNNLQSANVFIPIQ